MARSSGANSGGAPAGTSTPLVTVVPAAPVNASVGPFSPAMTAALASLRNAVLFLVQRVSEGLTLCVLLLSAVLATASIAEISSRQQARSQVDVMEREETALLMSQISALPMTRG